MIHYKFKDICRVLAVLFSLMNICACGKAGIEPDIDPPQTITPTTPPDVMSLDVLECGLKWAIPYMINYTGTATKYKNYRSYTIDNYAGYWSLITGKFDYSESIWTLYKFPHESFKGPACTELYGSARYSIKRAYEFGAPYLRAIALIIEAYLGHEQVDFYGAWPYRSLQNYTYPLVYENGADVYAQIFEDIDEARQILLETQPSVEQLQRCDLLEDGMSISRGDWTRWVKFANCIQLRMAMNIVKYNESLAKKKAEAAVAAPYGVLSILDSYDLGYYNESRDCQLYDICNRLNEIRLGASFENILKHFNHPLLYQWFDKNPYPIYHQTTNQKTGKGTDVYGVRTGILLPEQKQGKNKGGYGPFGSLSEKFRHMHQDFFKRTECYFLRAEGALRGWNMDGTPKELYEEGIRMGFFDNGIDDFSVINAYLEQDNLPAVDYVDPYQSQHNIKGRVTCGVKWNDADDKELKLEKIITQKYIANFPMGAEAWTTFRRTGYPRLFPVVNNFMPDVDTELQIRRIPLDSNVSDTFIESFGDPQNPALRVFWDVATELRGDDVERNGFGIVIPRNF